ncbi:MAG: GntR family transcriptional regulator [Phycisphaeraceae bacterium]
MASSRPSSSTRVAQIVRELRDRLAAGHWSPGQKIDSEHALAALFAVSRGTIASALRELAREGLLRSEHGKGWFVSAAHARRTGLVAVLFPDLSIVHDPIPRAHLRGIQRTLESTGTDIWLSAMPQRQHQPPSANDWLDLLDPSQIDGVIIATREVMEQRALALADHLPLVWLDHPAVPPRIGGAQPDFLGGAFDAVSHLIELGHRHIGLITIERSFTQGWEQIEGARLAMRRLLASNEGELHATEVEWNHPRHGQNAAQQMLASADRPTAIVAGSDELALGTCRAMQGLNLRLPEDVSLIGWNDVMDEGTFPVPMTTVVQVAEQVGAAAARQLLEMIEQPTDLTQTQRLAMPFVVRQSTAPPTSASPKQKQT